MLSSPGMVAETRGAFSFGDRLPRIAANTGNSHGLPVAHLLGGKGEDRGQQTRLANRELSSVHADGDPAPRPRPDSSG
jgi:hypothetical protein